MRAILPLTTMLVCSTVAAPMPEHPCLADSIAAPAAPIATAQPRSDRLGDAALPAAEPSALTRDIDIAVPPLPAAPESTGTSNEQPSGLSLDDLCGALFSAAEDNDLPVPFFANLIWQESRLREDSVSSKGALGIAQFMPEVAVETGLNNPLDPLQAIPASARLLRALRQHFGNLGYAAAAYNAGPHRVSDWLQRGRTLPRETRDYVVRVTGRSAEQWRTTPPEDGALRFVRPLPCRELPAFADLEQAQAQQAQADQETSAQGQQTKAAHGEAAEKAAQAEPHPDIRVAARRHAIAKATEKYLRIAGNDPPAEMRHSRQARQAARERPANARATQLAALKVGRRRIAAHRGAAHRA